jgi:hypothetical protein
MLRIGMALKQMARKLLEFCPQPKTETEQASVMVGRVSKVNRARPKDEISHGKFRPEDEYLLESKYMMQLNHLLDSDHDMHEMNSSSLDLDSEDINIADTIPILMVAFVVVAFAWNFVSTYHH